MSTKLPEQAFASRLLDLNSESSSLDLSFAMSADSVPFGAELLTFSPECFADSIAQASHIRPDGRGDRAGMIFNDRQPIAA